VCPDHQHPPINSHSPTYPFARQHQYLTAACPSSPLREVIIYIIIIIISYKRHRCGGVSLTEFISRPCSGACCSCAQPKNQFIVRRDTISGPSIVSSSLGGVQWMLAVAESTITRQRSLPLEPGTLKWLPHCLKKVTPRATAYCITRRASRMQPRPMMRIHAVTLSVECAVAAASNLIY